MKKRGLFKFLLFVVVISLVAGLGFVAFGMDRKARNNLIIACIADKKVGDPLIFYPDYSESEELMFWGILTNSRWLADQVRLIVPYLVREGVAAESVVGIYPDIVAFSPYAASQSFKIAGQASPNQQIVWINERLIFQTEPSLSDVFSTLVHELIHLQRGYFFNPNDILKTEAYTVAATTEVLAGMCRAGKPEACQAFWMEIKGMALTAAKESFVRDKISPVFDTLMNILFRDKSAEERWKKWVQDYPENPDISLRYSLYPYEELIIPNVLNQTEMRVTNLDLQNYAYSLLIDPLMPFDDTEYLLGSGIITLLRQAYYWQDQSYVSKVVLREETMFEYDLTLELFGALFGGIISVFFSWCPGLRTWFAGLSKTFKQLTMLGFSLALIIFIGVSSCTHLWTFMTCDKVGFMKLATVWFFFLVSNQSIYRIVPAPEDVEEVKELTKDFLA